ncbi:transglutaminase-like domain-containing protein [Flagellimonas crocea]|uniref:transglutaminase-like domain-containing protein n=1 Tax=Flagellimonas crocea TaxID=3067311 RepID=UPI00296FD606|nr:transglutaminase-like domain-containing protein [Muricauda sp. DH64]
MSFRSIWILSVFVSVILALQVVNAKEIEFGKVSKEEVLADQHTYYPEANAAILYKSDLVHFDFHDESGWRIVREVFLRIKIYNKEGLNWASLQTSLLTNNDYNQNISEIKGFTFNSLHGNIVKTKLKDEGVFREKVNDDQEKVSITMPDVKEGSVLDIGYKIQSSAFWNIDEFWLQFDIPVDFALVQLKIPEYFIYKQYNRGYYPIELEQSQENRSIKVTPQTYDFKRPVNVTIGKETLNFVDNIFSFTASGLPGLVPEYQALDINDHRSSIKFELTSTKFPNEPHKNYTLTWEDVAKLIYEYDGFGKELNRKDYFEDDIKNVILGTTTEMKRAMAIYNFVKSKMNWDYNFGILCSSKGIDQAYNEEKGNVADINLMLTAMFRYAGLKADPVLISSRTNGIPLSPTEGAFNYVISGLQLQNDLILFDATEKLGYPDIIPLRAVNWVGRLIRENGTTREVILEPNRKSLIVGFTTVELKGDGSIVGKCRNHITGYFALYSRKKNSGGPKDSYRIEMEKKYPSLEISDFEVLNQDDASKPLVQIYNYIKESAFEEIGGKLNFTPLFHLSSKNNPYKAEERNLPIDKIFTQSFKNTVTIKIPDGYFVESTPENMVAVLPKNIGSFTYEVWVEDDIIKVKSKIEWNTAVIPPNYYSNLKEFHNQIIKKGSEQVVLAKL